MSPRQRSVPEPARTEDDERKRRPVSSSPAMVAETDLAPGVGLPLQAGNRATTAAIQAKLEVGPAGNRYEREADSVARRVVASISSPVQRQEPEEEEPLQGKRVDGAVSVQRQPEEEEELQAKRVDGAGPVQRQEPEEEELQAKRVDGAVSVQREPEEEEELQAKRVEGAGPVQRQDIEEEEELQAKRVDGAASVQRQPEEEEELQAKRVEEGGAVQRQPEEEEELMMRPDAAAAPAHPVVGLEGGGLDPSTEAGIQGARGRGKPLDEGIRSSMEQAFGTDFGDVRVHHSADSDRHNRAIQAKAFTTGSDIFFRSGDYSPSTSQGQELLAHELTHVVQQRGGIQRKIEIQQADDLDDDDIEMVTNPLYDADAAKPASTRTGGAVMTSNPLYDATKARPASVQAPKEKGWFGRKAASAKKGLKRTFGTDFSAENKRTEAMAPAETKRIGEQIRKGQELEKKLIANGADPDEAYDQAFKGVPREYRPARRTSAEKAVRRNEGAIREGNVEVQQEQQRKDREAAVAKRLGAKGWNAQAPGGSNGAATAGKLLGTGGSVAGAVGSGGSTAGSVGEKGLKVPLLGEVIGKDAKMESGGKGTGAISGGVQHLLGIASSIAKIKDASARAKSENPVEREKGMDDLQDAVIGLGQSAQSANGAVDGIINFFKDGSGATPGLAIIANAQTLITQIPKLVDLSYRVHQERIALQDAEKSGADAALSLSLGRVLSRNVQLLAHHVVTIAVTIKKLIASVLEVAGPAAVGGAALKTIATVVDYGNQASQALIDSYRAGKTQEARGKWRGTHEEGSAEKLLAADAQQAIQAIISEAKDGNPLAIKVMGGYGIREADLGKASDRDLRELLMGKLQEAENPRTITQKIKGAYQAVKSIPSTVKQKHKDVKALASVKNELGYGGKTDRGKGWYIKQMLRGDVSGSRAKVMQDIDISQKTGKTTTDKAFGAEQGRALTDTLYGRGGGPKGPEISGPMSDEEMKALTGAPDVAEREEELAH